MNALFTLDHDEINRVLQWLNAVEDLNRAYLEPEDFNLAQRLKGLLYELTHGPTIEDNSQNWAGMDGAIAWRRIFQHADSWADTGKMMNEWLAANQQGAIK